jgi:hypothetical protein
VVSWTYHRTWTRPRSGSHETHHQVCGVAVHQATTIASVREESGRIIARSILPSEEGALLEVRRHAWLRARDLRGGHAGAVAARLAFSPVHRVLVCDRRGEKRQGNKGDVVDADQLSNDLLRGSLRAVYHGSGHRAALKELARTYENAVEDTTRTMLRLKALFRARAIRTPGQDVYQPESRGEWLSKLPERGARFRAGSLTKQLAMLAEARKDPAWERLRSLPFLGLARYRTSSSAWSSAG